MPTGPTAPAVTTFGVKGRYVWDSVRQLNIRPPEVQSFNNIEQLCFIPYMTATSVDTSAGRGQLKVTAQSGLVAVIDKVNPGVHYWNFNAVSEISHYLVDACANKLQKGEIKKDAIASPFQSRKTMDPLYCALPSNSETARQVEYNIDFNAMDLTYAWQNDVDYRIGVFLTTTDGIMLHQPHLLEVKDWWTTSTITTSTTATTTTVTTTSTTVTFTTTYTTQAAGAAGTSSGEIVEGLVQAYVPCSEAGDYIKDPRVKASYRKGIADVSSASEANTFVTLSTRCRRRLDSSDGDYERHLQSGTVLIDWYIKVDPGATIAGKPALLAIRDRLMLPEATAQLTQTITTNLEQSVPAGTYRQEIVSISQPAVVAEDVVVSTTPTPEPVVLVQNTNDQSVPGIVIGLIVVALCGLGSCVASKMLRGRSTGGEGQQLSQI